MKLTQSADIMIEQKHMPLTSGTQIFDEEHNEEIVITDEMIARSQHAKQKIEQSLFAVAEGLADIRDYRLYLVDNCSSFRAWLEQCAGMARRTAYNYLTVIDKYANRHGVVQLVAHPLEQIGIRKLLEIARLPKEPFERFKRTGEIVTSDEQVLNLQAIEQMPVRRLQEYLQPLRGSGPAASQARSSHYDTMKCILQSISKQLPHLDDDALQEYAPELQALEQRITQRLQQHRDV